MGQIKYSVLAKVTLEEKLGELRTVDGDVEWMQWPDDSYRSDLPEKWVLSRIAEDRGRIIGYALCSAKGEAVWLHRIVVSPDYRGKGVGAGLLREVEMNARSAGYATLGLRTPASNAATRRFYENNEFSALPGEGEYVTMYRELAPRMVGIHQPNYLPWLGYFYKLSRSDVFVVLDDVLAPSRGYFNRSRVLVQGAGRWLTVPVHRGDGYINHMEPSGAEWVDKHLRTIKHSYQRAPFYDTLIPGISETLHSHAGSKLAVLNESLIVHVAELLGITTPLVKASEFDIESTGDERLVELVQAVGGSRYLSGRGGDNYQQPETFSTAGIELTYTGFSNVPYCQSGADDFEPGLSVIDALFNIGPEASGELLRSAPDPTADGSMPN